VMWCKAALLIAAIAAVGLVSCKLTDEKNTGSEEYFYIFDWPAELTNSWPPPGTKMVLPRGRIPRPLQYVPIEGTNFGVGKVLNESYGLHSTNYFHLYHLVMSRLRIHPKRTYNRSAASMFVVPFDAGIAAQWDKSNGQYRMHQAFGGADVVQELVSLMKEDISKTPLRGHDVLMVNSLFNTFNENISKIFFECMNCTVINHDTNRAYDNYQYKFAKNNGVVLASAQFGVPYMSAIHYHDGMQDIPWRAGQDRPVLVAFWAATVVQHQLATILRQKLAQQCEERVELCVAVKVSNRKAEPCYSKSAENCHQDKPVNVTSPLQAFGGVGLDLYRLSQYCLQPPGDMDGRKAMSDAILLGCIPVIFNAHLMSKKYSWFYPPEVEREVALYIPWGVVARQKDFNFVDYIASIPPEVTKAKQAALAKLAEKVVYSVPPAKMSEYAGFGGAPGESIGGNWSPPFKDAVDVIVDSTFARIQRYLRSSFMYFLYMTYDTKLIN
jgi:hypothetical protein